MHEQKKESFTVLFKMKKQISLQKASREFTTAKRYLAVRQSMVMLLTSANVRFPGFNNMNSSLRNAHTWNIIVAYQ